ncbi:MAG: flagellar hook assembly protein FlgD [Loktanella sp.]|nr:flagellar hook assembly protein FlgD [Loktanella sp.]
MEIGQTTRPAASDQKQTSAKPRISSDFDTFLKMLTAQMKNQDPLNPIESADFATQLATFSGVEQAVVTNDLLRDLTAQIGVTGMADMAAWVGKEARAAAPAYFDGSPITLYPRPMNGAQSGEIVVRDVDGFIVQRFAAPTTGAALDWTGAVAGGTLLPEGVYDFTYISIANGERIGATGETKVDVYAPVTEIRSDAGKMQVVVKGGVSVPASDVTALRDPLR